MSTDAQEIQEGEVSQAQTAQPEGIQPESSTGSGENHEQKQDGVQSRINQLTAKRYQAEREADEWKRKFEELERNSQQKTQVVSEGIEPPKPPEDWYDEQATAKYHSDMAEYSRKVAQRAAQSEYEQRQKQASESQAQAKQSEVLGKYAQNALRDGVDLDKLKVAEQAINQAGVSNELAGYIMNDTNGGKIVEYLYDNPALMHEVLKMDPVSAGIKIANEIKPQALSTTPAVSQAPAPTPDIGGGGGYVDKDDFERENPGTVFK